MQRMRQSISAECTFGKAAQESFVARKIEKSQEAREKIRQRLSKAIMFECLGEQDMDIIIDAMESRHFEPGDYIIKENDPGEELFMVENGEFSCHKVINGEDTLLKYYKSGDVFGELALLYNAPRAASLKAVEPSDAWALDRATFNFIVKDASKKKRETYKNFLSSVHILKNLDVYERSKIADALKEKKVSKGETIIQMGDMEDNFFYIILQGSAVATLDDD